MRVIASRLVTMLIAGVARAAIVLLSVAGLTASLAAETVAAATASYPDVWERALPFPAGWPLRVDKQGPIIGRRADGEVVIVVEHEGRFHATEFFSGRSQAGVLAKRPIISELQVQREARFSDGWVLRGTDSPGLFDYGCDHSFGAKLTVSRDRLVQRFHLIARLDEPRSSRVKGCSGGQAFAETAFAPPLRVHVLDDDSFLAVMPEIGKAIRIRRDLTSPALDHRRFYLVRDWHVRTLPDAADTQAVVLAKLDRVPPAHAQAWLGPAYPNVWERRLARDPAWTMDDWIVRTGSPVVGRRADGEVVIVMMKDGRFVATEFFSGRSESGLLAESAILEELIVQESPRLSDGRFVASAVSAYVDEACYDGLFPRLRIGDQRYLLIARLEQPRPVPIRPECARQKGLAYDERILAPPMQLHALDDDSFLLVAPELGKAIRIRDDLHSPAIDYRNLYLVPLWYVANSRDPRAKHDAVLARLDSLPRPNAPPEFAPPYPDLWRVALPDLGPTRRLKTFAAHLPNGDIAIVMENRGRRAIVEFFAGRVTHGSRDVDQELDLSWLSRGNDHFADGTRLSLDGSNLVEERCYDGFNAEHSLAFEPEDEPTDYLHWWLLAYLDRPRNPPLRWDCPSNAVNFYEYVFAVPLTNAIGLPDNTIIVVAPEIGAALRLRRDLTSPAIDGKKLLVLKPGDVPSRTDDAKGSHDIVRAYLDRRRRSLAQ